MKPTLIIIFSLLMFSSCGNDKKKEPSNQIRLTAPKTDKVKPQAKEKTSTPAVVVDTKGVAHILITSNDVMKFNVKKMTVKAGQKIKLTLEHTGTLDKKIMGHNVVILKKGVNLSAFASVAAAANGNDYIPVGTADVIAHTKMIGGGESTTIEFTAPEAGIYDFICSFPAHFALMKGKFIVE
ncbi:azurin [Flavobacteriaceae bacterium]|nr:azurin [Flavobacteriaceae bacterium]